MAEPLRCDYRGGCAAPAAVNVVCNVTFAGFGGDADGDYEMEVEDLCIRHADAFEEELRSDPLPILGAMLENWKPAGTCLGRVSITTHREPHQ